MFRSTPAAVLNMYVKQLGLDPAFMDNANLAHGPIAARIMERTMDQRSRCFECGKISYHWPGGHVPAGKGGVHPGILAIEPGREYPGVEPIRRQAEVSLDQACLLAMERSITYIEQRGLFLHEDTIKARNDLKKKGEINGL